MVLFRVMFSVYVIVSFESILLAQNGNVGINTTTPAATLDVEGRIRMSDDANEAQHGMIRWNAETEDFEGFTGTQWLSLTKSRSTWGNIVWSDAVEDTKVTDSSLEQFARFGKGVAMEEDYAIVGAPGDQVGNNSGQGSAFIYERSGDSWIMVQQITASNGQAGNGFGYAVDISGDYAIVGAHQYSGSSGTAYIFYRSGSTWVQEAQITGTDVIPNDLFGFSVGISGDYAIVGALYDDVGAIIDPGSAYIFYRTGTSWSQQAKLSALDATTNDEFGTSVSISGDRVIIGAPSDDATFTNQGSVYFFTRSGTSWPQTAKKVAIESGANDNFGKSVFIQGDNAVAGAPNDDLTFTNQGVAYFFKYVAGVWDNGVKIVAKTPVANGFFGSTVSLNGAQVLVASSDDGIGYKHGTVSVFNQETPDWRQIIRLSPGDGFSGDNFGNSFRASGDYIIIGSPDDNIGTSLDKGSIYFFRQKE